MSLKALWQSFIMELSAKIGHLLGKFNMKTIFHLPRPLQIQHQLHSVKDYVGLRMSWFYKILCTLAKWGAQFWNCVTNITNIFVELSEKKSALVKQCINTGHEPFCQSSSVLHKMTSIWDRLIWEALMIRGGGGLPSLTVTLGLQLSAAWKSALRLIGSWLCLRGTNWLFLSEPNEALSVTCTVNLTFILFLSLVCVLIFNHPDDGGSSHWKLDL